ncbi:replication initiation protein [Clostridium celatum]|uniref:replication initiation protein n=1 Tax=Clostridium celatum TaxID=36834 RepID=UPI00319E377B
MIRFSNAFLKAKSSMETLPLYKVVLVCCNISKKDYTVNKEYELSEYRILKTLNQQNHKIFNNFKHNQDIVEKVYLQNIKGDNLLDRKGPVGITIFSSFGYDTNTKRFYYTLNDQFVQKFLFVDKNYTDLNMSIIGDFKSIYQCKLYALMITNVNFPNKYNFNIKELFDILGYKENYGKFISKVFNPMLKVLEKHGLEIILSDVVRKGAAAKSPVISISLKMKKIDKKTNVVFDCDNDTDSMNELIKLKENIKAMLDDMSLSDNIEKFGIMEVKTLFKSSCNGDKEFTLACIYAYCVQCKKSQKDIQKYPFAIARKVNADETGELYNKLIKEYKGYLQNGTREIVIESLDNNFKALTFEENINNIAAMSNNANANTIASTLNMFLEEVDEDIIIASFYEVINKDKNNLSLFAVSNVINEINNDKTNKKKQAILDRYERHLKYNGNNYDKDDRVDKVLTELVKYKKAPTIKDIKSARELVVNYSTNQIISKMNEIFSNTYNSAKGYNLGYIQKIIESGANGKPIKSKSSSNAKKESNENRRVIGFKECNISGKDIKKELESQLGTGKIVDFDKIFRKH